MLYNGIEVVNMKKILSSYAFYVIVYIICLIVYSITKMKAFIAIPCPIMLFFVFACGMSYSNSDPEEQARIFQFIEWIAIVSMFFILRTLIPIPLADY